MFKKIAVGYDESGESHRALLSAIALAKSLDAELETISVMTSLPSYTVFAAAGDPSLIQTLRNDRTAFYENLQNQARDLALTHGVPIRTHVIEGPEVDSVLHFLTQQGTDLLVIGLHRRSLHISRMWSTVYELAQEAPCSVLGVH